MRQDSDKTATTISGPFCKNGVGSLPGDSRLYNHVLTTFSQVAKIDKSSKKCEIFFITRRL